MWTSSSSGNLASTSSTGKRAISVAIWSSKSFYFIHKNVWRSFISTLAGGGGGVHITETKGISFVLLRFVKNLWNLQLSTSWWKLVWKIIHLFATAGNQNLCRAHMWIIVHMCSNSQTLEMENRGLKCLQQHHVRAKTFKHLSYYLKFQLKPL